MCVEHVQQIPEDLLASIIDESQKFSCHINETSLTSIPDINMDDLVQLQKDDRAIGNIRDMLLQPMPSYHKSKTSLVVRRNIGQMAYRVELEYILFCRLIRVHIGLLKTIFFRGCAKFRPLTFLKIQYGRRHTQISLNWL